MAQMFMISDIEYGYRKILHELFTYGEEVAPRGQQTFEMLNAVLVHEDPEKVLLTGIGRGLSQPLAALEALQLVGGFSDPDLTVHVAPYYSNFLDNGMFHGAYGVRTQDSVGLVAERLRIDPATRQANMQFWNDRQDLAIVGMHDYPCTMHANFVVRDESLYMTTVMRSNDAWLGYPYDVVQFTTLQKTLAGFLGVDTGVYTHIAHSLHLYQRNFEAAEKLLATQPDRSRSVALLEGGVVVPDAKNWSEVQDRAMQICYDPEAVEPKNSTEEWLIKQAMSWMPFLEAREYDHV